MIPWGEFFTGLAQFTIVIAVFGALSIGLSLAIIRWIEKQS